MTLTELSIKRPAALAMFFLAVVVMGIILYQRLAVNLLPAMDWPMAGVITTWPGAGPREVETMVSKPLEDGLISLNKLKHIRTYNRENVSVIILEFDMSADPDVVLQETQRIVNAARSQLPEDIKEPLLFKADLAALPILRVAVSSQLPGPELFTLVDQKIRPRLEQIDGVGQINISGAEEREIQIAIDPDKLKTHGLSLDDINRVLASDNLDLPAGKIYGRSQDFTVRMAGKYATLGEIERTRIPLPNGSAIFLRDIATVTDTIKADRSMDRLNTERALGIQIVKQSQANSVKTAALVRAELAGLEKQYQGLIKIDVAQDITTFTKDSISEVQRNVLEALITVALVLLVFLHSLRNSLIVLIAIPISLISTFITMALFGFSVNLMTMMALGLVVGVLVDDSVVVLENIHRWLKKGADPTTAAIQGRNEIGLAAISISLVDVVIFLPVALLTGIVGNIFREFSIAFVTAVLMSLLVSFTVTPLLASRLNDKDHLEGEKWMRGFARRFERWFHSLEEQYRHLLNWALSHRWRVVLVASLLMIGSIALIPLGFIGTDFIPQTDSGQFQVSAKMPLGTTLDETNNAVEKIEGYCLGLKDVERVFTTVGQQETGMGIEDNPRLASVQVKLRPRKDRVQPLRKTENDIARFARTIPGLDLVISDIGMFGSANEAPIQYEVRGQNLDSVNVAANHAVDILRSTPGARDVQTSYELGSPELQVIIDREKAANSNLTPGEIAMALRNAVNGNVVTRFSAGDVDVDVRSILTPRYRTDPSLVTQIEIRNHVGQMVKLADVARVERTSGPSTISHKDRERVITVTANIEGRSLGEVQGALDKEMKKYTPPTGVTFSAAGDVQNMRDMMSDMVKAIFLSILFVYMILVSLYESYIHPFVVMFSVPVAIVGAFLSLAITGNSLSMFSMIGILILVGLVTKNGILLVDFTNLLRSRGMDRREALLTAGPLRLRPILMTTATMVVGMMPLALALGEGSEMRAGMGAVIVGGLLSSLFLTLILVPVMYTFLDRFSRKHRHGTSAEAVAIESNGREVQQHVAA
ncbi:MAG TPA: efflux RND transporter permease subunit [bacterium]|jgi:HAE1 family hydrophobic/amphiphilic exporter-1